MATHHLSRPNFGFTDKRQTASSNDDTDSLSAASHTASQSNDTLDAALITAGYTQAQIDHMTQNDKVYACRLANDSASI